MALIVSIGHAFAEEPPPAPKPVQGGSGKISFTGTINNDACTIDGSDKDRIIAMDMGDIAIKDMGTAENPTSGRVSGQDFNLNVNCNTGTKVAMVFDANSGGSGLVPGKKVLALNSGNGTATNVGIALLDANGALIDLSSKSTARLESAMKKVGDGGETTLSFSAAYVTTGAEGTATAGRGDATLPFILEYE
ncbi:fimbrial protein [Pseudomonas sp. zfem004]|uniref:fimbrial protein n=1 Tax=unclassified Pseudomonas TaxID=196821 RepID=UPI00129ABDEC|nr:MULTISPECIES: fimbrial protein [unclassified Pseudomonas]MDU9404193.1 fimbrial protein [Pseudomonas sp. zfem004]